jgi:hypothetical protein
MLNRLIKYSAHDSLSGERARPRVLCLAPRRALCGDSREDPFGEGAERCTRGACAPQNQTALDQRRSCLSNSSSVNSVNCSGFSRYAASTSSPSAVSFGRGVGSRMISSHRASPSSSGTNFGNDSANRARSASGNSRIAAAISSTVLTINSYNTGHGSATLQHQSPC